MAAGVRKPLTAPSCLGSLVLAPCIFPPLNKRVGSLACFRLGMCIFMTVNFCFPFLRDARNADSPALLLVSAMTISIVRGFGGPLSFGSISVLLNNHLKKNLGTMNGLASSFASLARAVGPAISGAIYAASTTSPFPFDSAHAPFYSLCIMCLLTLLLTLGMSKS